MYSFLGQCIHSSLSHQPQEFLLIHKPIWFLLGLSNIPPVIIRSNSNYFRIRSQRHTLPHGFIHRGTIAWNDPSVLCLFASSPCTQRFFSLYPKTILCTENSPINYPYSSYTLRYFPRILQICRRNEEYAEKIFTFNNARGLKGTVFRKNEWRWTTVY